MSSYTDAQADNQVPFIETDFIPVIPVTDIAPHPVYKADRVKTIDMIRGVALLGILMMNIPIFGLDRSELSRVIHMPHNSTDFRTFEVIEAFFGGTMRTLFSMLFGAGMVLFTLNKHDKPGGATVAEYYYRRLLWLVFFGIINAYVLMWEGDILFYYGLAGMLLYPFRKTAVKWLLLLGILCLSINHIKGMFQWNEAREVRAKYLSAIAAEKAHKKLTPEQENAKERWLEIEKNRQPDMDKAARNVAEMRGSYITVLKHLVPVNSMSETWGTYHATWDWLSMMFIGMALFYLGFFSDKLATSTYVAVLLVGYGVGIPVALSYFEAYKGEASFGAYLDQWRVPHWALYDLRRLLLALGHASLIVLVYRSKMVPWLMRALGNVGQMAFSNYLMQSIFCSLIFFGYGFGYYNKLAYHQLYFVVAGIWVFQLIFSSVWLRYFRFGPFEWLWRSLTYWKKQPMIAEKQTAV